MKVLFDWRPVRTPISGVARYCIDLGLSLENTELDIKFLGQNFKNRNLELEKFRKVTENTLENSKVSRKIENLCYEIGLSSNLFHDFKPDIIHETYFAKLECSKNTRKVSTIHDIIPITNPELLSRMNVFFSKINFKRQVMHSDAIITPSEYTKKKILEYYPKYENKINVIPLGVTQNLIDYINLSNYEDKTKTDYFVIVGNIEPRKNLETLCWGIKLLNERLKSNFKLKVIGRENVNASGIKNNCRSLLGNNVDFLGFIDEQDKYRIIKNSLGLVFPSTYEGFGIPGIESMALGVPTVLANNSSLSELAMDEWQLFETMNYEELSYKLEDIINEDTPIDFKKLSEDILKKYKWSNIANETKKIYKSII